MKREQYTGLLKAYLEKESRANMDYVLADCNAYFDVAEEQGFTDEEIIESLGSPKAVYEVYYREGKMASGSYLTQAKLALNRGRQLLEKTGAQGRMAGSPREDRAGMGKNEADTLQHRSVCRLYYGRSGYGGYTGYPVSFRYSVSADSRTDSAASSQPDNHGIICWSGNHLFCDICGNRTALRYSV